MNRQIENEMLAPVLRYGLIKERISALITDGIRAALLEECGYDTQILEFIDMEHTPKNILIRAVKREKMGMVPSLKRQGNMPLSGGEDKEMQTALMCKALHVETTLQKLLNHKI